MPRHVSSTDLGGLAASMTPRLPRMDVTHTQQSSGFFDIGALYADALEQVARRVDGDSLLASVTRVRSARAAGAERAAVLRAPVELDGQVGGDRDRVIIEAPGRASSRPMRWFFVAVSWLAMTTGAALATTLPAHGVVRMAPASVLALAATPVVTSALAAPSVIAPAGAPARVVVDAWQPVGGPAVAAPVITATPAAPFMVPQVALPQRSHAKVAPAHVHASLAVAKGVPAAVPSVSPVSGGSAVSKANAPLPSGTSLDDLIRREVQAESKRP